MGSRQPAPVLPPAVFPPNSSNHYAAPVFGGVGPYGAPTRWLRDYLGGPKDRDLLDHNLPIGGPHTFSQASIMSAEQVDRQRSTHSG